MDLEWNQNPYGNSKRRVDLNFEIIEIGAVKLDDNLNYVDKFSQVIKPKVFKKLHYKTAEITHFTNDELKKGKSFPKVMRQFLEWCGDDYIFCTWGAMDLHELQANMKFFGYERILDFPLFYYDLQKIFSLCYEDGKNKRNLTSAVEFLNINGNKEFHRALSDAYYTAKVMQKMDFEKFKKRVSIDTYYYPRIKEEEIFVSFGDYNKRISREMWSKTELFEDDDFNNICCSKCNKKVKVLIDWFSDSGKTYYSLGKCRKHGYVKGRIRVKKIDRLSFFVIKILKNTDKDGARKIVEKQNSIREKRREKRQRILDREIVIEEL